MLPGAMEFITITTGATSIARRADLTEDTMALARELIAGIANGVGWSIAMIASHPTSHCWSISLGGEDVCCCYLCVDIRVSDKLWDVAEGIAPDRTVLHRPRGVPWLAASLSPGVVGLPRDLLMALPWLEAAVAWALLEEQFRHDPR